MARTRESASEEIRGSACGVDELRDELEQWRAALPQSLQDSDKAAQLTEAITNLESISNAIAPIVDDAEVEFPRHVLIRRPRIDELDNDSKVPSERHHGPAILAPAISDLRLRRSVAHRSGQTGCITRKNGYFVVRFRQDVPGQMERVLRSVRICPEHGAGKLTKCQRELRKKQIIEESKANDLDEARNAAATTSAVTFREQSETWLRSVHNRKRDPVKPRTLTNWKSHLAWLVPRVGDIPLRDLTPARAKKLVTAMANAGLSAKSINNYFGVFTLVIASAKDDEGKELYPQEWDPDYLDLPKVDRDGQKRLSFKAEQIEQIISRSEPEQAMLYALLAGAGLRIGEALGLEIRHFVGDALYIEHALWNARAYSPKTEAGKRTVELSPDLARALRHFIGSRQTGYIFRAENGKPIHQSNLLRRSLHPLLKELGIEKQGFHGFRRFRVTHLRKQRVLEVLLKIWVGHSRTSVTDDYVRLEDDPEYRKLEAEKAGLGFQLKSLYLFPDVPLVPNIENQVQVFVA